MALLVFLGWYFAFWQKNKCAICVMAFFSYAAQQQFCLKT